MNRRRMHRLVSLPVTVLVALTAVIGLGVGPAGSSAIKGTLVIDAVSDDGTGLVGAVQGRPFTVQVHVEDAGLPVALTRDTSIRLSASGPGQLGPNVTGVIPKDSSQGTISGATYAPFANGVTLTVSTTGGVALTPSAPFTINVAQTAVKAVGSPHVPLDVTDPGCAAPTKDIPVCGFLRLPNGAGGTILLSVGSCSGIDVACLTNGATNSRIVRAALSFKDELGAPLYTRTNPATFILGCDKTLCANGGVPNFPVKIDASADGTGAFVTAESCPAKGVIGPNQTFCKDDVQSKRDIAGDLFTFILVSIDPRGTY